MRNPTLPTRAFSTLTAVLLVGACSPGADAPAASGDALLPEGHPPLSQPSAAPEAGPAGIVLETMESGGYTYALVDVDGEEIWVAGPSTPMQEGDRVSLGGAMGMENFHAASLDRTFETILFVNRFAAPGAEGGAVAGGGPGMEGAHRGTVLETLSAAGYTYVRVDEDGTERWLAGPSTPLEEGQVVAWDGGAVMRDFDSPSLGRTFDEILFVEGIAVRD